MTEKEIIRNIFAFEDFINSNSQILINRKELKVVWAVRGTDGKTLRGFLRIGRKYIAFYAYLSEKDLTVWIPGIGHILFEKKTIQEFFQEKEGEKR